MSDKPLPITELLRRIGDENIGIQTPTAEGTFLSANKRKGYTALEFATYPELAEEMMRGRLSKTLLVLVVDQPVVDRAKADHHADAPLPLTARERELLMALRQMVGLVVGTSARGPLVTYDDWKLRSDRDEYPDLDCATCDNIGEELVCPDDMCQGVGECMHGDGTIVCRECHGKSAL